eukprot:gene5837-7265_t
MNSIRSVNSRLLNNNNSFIRSQLFKNNSNKTFNNQYSYSVSKDQRQIDVNAIKPKKSKGSILLKILGVVLVGKISYDVTNSVMAYFKGTKPVDDIVAERWNDSIYPIFKHVIQDKDVVNALGYPVTLGAPPSQSTTPITEIQREFTLGLFTPKPTLDAGIWYFKKVPQLSTNPKDRNSNNADEQQKQKQMEKIGEYTVLESSELLSQFELPALVPYTNKLLFAFPHGETTSELVLPIRGSKEKGQIFITLYANDDQWHVRKADVKFPLNNTTVPKTKSIVKPNLHDSYLKKQQQQQQQQQQATTENNNSGTTTTTNNDKDLNKNQSN